LLTTIKAKLATICLPAVSLLVLRLRVVVTKTLLLNTKAAPVFLVLLVGKIW
jgi:hypothetical protein